MAAALRARLDPEKPPHVGVLLRNTPFFSSLLVAAGLTGIVPVGLNPIRRGAALERDIRHADCQVVLADSASAAVVGDIDHIDVDSPEWAAEVAAHHDAPVTVRDAEPDDTVHADLHVGHQRRSQGGASAVTTRWRSRA